MTYRIRNIGIAVALAIVAALLTTFYVTNYKRTVQQGEDMVPVYVAAQRHRDRHLRFRARRPEAAQGRARLPPECRPGCDLQSRTRSTSSSPSSPSTPASRSPRGASAQPKSRASAPSSRATCAPFSSRAASISSWPARSPTATVWTSSRTSISSPPSARYRRLACRPSRSPGPTRTGHEPAPEQDRKRSVVSVLGDAGPHGRAGTEAPVRRRRGRVDAPAPAGQDPADSPESIETVDSVLGDGLRLGQRRALRGGR